MGLIVRGRVQGVSYRASTRAEAERLGLTGWVQNRPDGSVGAEVQGDDAKVHAFVSWCRRGPPGAQVTGVEVETLSTLSETHFAIRH